MRLPRQLPAEVVLISATVLAVAIVVMVRPSSAVSDHLAAAGSGKVVTHNCVNSTKRPNHIIIACGDGNAQLRSLRWRTWGGFSAKGRGKFLYNTCRPDCARGTMKRVAAKVRLSRARPCGNRGGRLHYRRARVRFPHERPSHYGASQRFRLFCPF